MTLGELIRRARERQGLNRETIAVRANVSVSTVQRTEADQFTPTVSALVAILQALDLPMSALEGVEFPVSDKRRREVATT